VLLSSERFREKAEDVVKEGTENKPLVAVDKILKGSQSAERIELKDGIFNASGMMLYTSGTTSRPVGCRESSSIFD
jgi:malonyl-CoA/methylmalonyl-CoA synthetase